METRVCWGLVAPTNVTEEKQVVSTTPDPETLKIMLAHDAYAKWEKAGPSNWDLMSNEERKAMLKKRDETQSQPWIPPGGPRPPYAERREPISGALYDERRVYTRKQGEEWKFWGIQEDGTTLEEFWAKYDPENTRNECESEDGESEAICAPFAAGSLSKHRRTSGKPRQSKQKVGKQPSGKVSKSRTSPPSNMKNSHRSLGSEKDTTIQQNDGRVRRRAAEPSGKSKTVQGSKEHRVTGNPQETEHEQQLSAAMPQSTKPGRGRPRKAAPVPATGHVLNSNEEAPLDEPTVASKRPRGRPPKQRNRKTGEENKSKRKLPSRERKARITKPRQTPKPPAPSTHKMRTRAKGAV